MNPITRVEQLLEEVGVRRAPVPVDKIAAHLGIEIRLAPTDNDVSGMLFRTGNQTVIGVNSAHHPNRRRFTIAHEIGHFLLPHQGTPVHLDKDLRINWRDTESSQAVNWEEIEANRFAAELLMPTSFLKRDLSRVGKLDYEVIHELAGKYKVSVAAMGFRLKNLGLPVPELAG